MKYPWLFPTALVAGSPPAWSAGEVNAARGKPIQFAPAPNYQLTARGDSDTRDLTDGKFSARQDAKLWLDSAAVGNCDFIHQECSEKHPAPAAASTGKTSAWIPVAAK